MIDQGCYEFQAGIFIDLLEIPGTKTKYGLSACKIGVLPLIVYVFIVMVVG